VVAPSKNSVDRDRVGYLPTLDGWRAIAILWVILSHQQLYRWGAFSNAYIRDTGDHGVLLFFALSGLLICGRLLREEQKFGSISLRSFYTRRVFRIQPAALAFLAVVLVASLVGAVPMFGQGMLGAALMVRNLWPGAKVPGSWLTAHFWSLSVEEHFYLLLPGFLVLFRRRRLAILATLVVLLEFWRVAVLHHPEHQWFSNLLYQRTDITVGAILLGSACAVALERERLFRMAQRFLQPWLAMLYAALVLTEQQFHFSRVDHAVLITVAPIVMIATMLHPESWLGRFLEWTPMRFLGRISYSLYLWQELFFNPFARPAQGTLQSHVVLCWLLTFACAIASYYGVERPMIKVGHRMAKRFPSKSNKQARLQSA
jgi:peptidoglycan/LPS O-acetylase OafA/YrhL